MTAPRFKIGDLIVYKGKVEKIKNLTGDDSPFSRCYIFDYGDLVYSSLSFRFMLAITNFHRISDVDSEAELLDHEVAGTLYNK